MSLDTIHGKMNRNRLVLNQPELLSKLALDYLFDSRLQSQLVLPYHFHPFRLPENQCILFWYQTRLELVKIYNIS